MSLYYFETTQLQISVNTLYISFYVILLRDIKVTYLFILKCHHSVTIFNHVGRFHDLGICQLHSVAVNKVRIFV